MCPGQARGGEEDVRGRRQGPGAHDRHPPAQDGARQARRARPRRCPRPRP